MNEIHALSTVGMVWLPNKQMGMLHNGKMEVYDHVYEACSWQDPYIYIGYRNGQERVVVNGVPQRWFQTIRRVSITADGRHYAYPAMAKGRWYGVVDGQVSPSYASITQWQYTADRQHIVYVGQSTKYDNSIRKKQYVVFDTTRYGPYQMVRTIRLSPTGPHWAVVVKQHGKEHVLWNGKLGPAYPAIIPSSVCPNEDGTDCAYVACADHKMYFCTFKSGQGPAYQHIRLCAYTHGHYAYEVVERDRSYFVIDGVPQPAYNEVSQFTFSREGTAWAYVALVGKRRVVMSSTRQYVLPLRSTVLQLRWVDYNTTPSLLIHVLLHNGHHQMIYNYATRVYTEVELCDYENAVVYCGKRGRRMRVFVNGDESPWWNDIDDFTLARDRKHYLYQARKGKLWYIVQSGEVGPSYTEITNLALSSDGHRAFYCGRVRRQWFVVWDEIGYGPYKKVDRVHWGRLSEHWATKVVQHGRAAVLWDGKLSRDWESVRSWSIYPFSDGSDCVYVANAYNTQWYLASFAQGHQPVSDGVWDIEYHDDGHHIAYRVRSDDSDYWVIDGQKQPHYSYAPWFRWSPDGAHWAYWALDGEQLFLVTDTGRYALPPGSSSCAIRWTIERTSCQ